MSALGDPAASMELREDLRKFSCSKSFGGSIQWNIFAFVKGALGASVSKPAGTPFHD
jgi:hypothetical protein